MLPFDDGGPATGTAQVEGQRFSRLTSTYNNRVKVLQCHTMPYSMRASVTEYHPRSSVHVCSTSKPASLRRMRMVSSVNL